jgi:hypothetical protein
VTYFEHVVVGKCRIETFPLNVESHVQSVWIWIRHWVFFRIKIQLFKKSGSEKRLGKQIPTCSCEEADVVMMSAKRLTDTLMAKRYSAPYKLNIVYNKSTSVQLKMCTSSRAWCCFRETLTCLLVELLCLWLNRGCRDCWGTWYTLRKWEIYEEFGFRTSRKEDLGVDGIVLEIILKYSYDCWMNTVTWYEWL